ncbi:hypothetical protein E2C01_015098 [Portunus trituberculatus]|uniref:Uncharacterized protein n=1 Tax=Portunus trituberculatus TaxID=210409 RepID=A0A5B7DKF5_PORTR|nr:hypothetical protein [Portunus trituberculatus]
MARVAAAATGKGKTFEVKQINNEVLTRALTQGGYYSHKFGEVLTGNATSAKGKVSPYAQNSAYLPSPSKPSGGPLAAASSSVTHTSAPLSCRHANDQQP